MVFTIIGKAIGEQINGRNGAQMGREIGAVIDTAIIPIIIKQFEEDKKKVKKTATANRKEKK